MKIINLDKFKVAQQVQINGDTYDVYGIPVGDYIEDDPIGKIDAIKEPKEQIRKMIETLGRYTNMPADVLKSQPYNVLIALILVIQGVDPNDKVNAAESAEGDSKKS